MYICIMRFNKHSIQGAEHSLETIMLIVTTIYKTIVGLLFAIEVKYPLSTFWVFSQLGNDVL